MEGFFKFPRTSHLLNGNSVTADDLVLSAREASSWLNVPVTLEEKIDGANLGISMDANGNLKTQNRAHFVNDSSHRQWNMLSTWIEANRYDLETIIGKDRILFGEWCKLKHSIYYTKLPSPFLAFDIYDKKRKVFLSRDSFHEILDPTSIPSVHIIAEKRVFTSLDEIKQIVMTEQSVYTDGGIEGVYLRIDDDEENLLLRRCKWVHPDFIQNISEHWTKAIPVKNIVQY